MSEQTKETQPVAAEVTKPKPKHRPYKPVESPKKKGIKPLFGVAMTSTERNQKWRRDRDIVTIQVPRAVAHALSEASRRTGIKHADIIAKAVEQHAI